MVFDLGEGVVRRLRRRDAHDAPWRRTGLFFRAVPSVDVRPRDRLRRALERAVRRHVTGHHHAAVLFSGGLDSSVLATLAERCLEAEHGLRSPEDDIATSPTLELVNVSFDPIAGPDRHAGLRSVGDLVRVSRVVRLELYLVERVLAEVDEDRVTFLLGPNDTVMDFNVAAALHCGSEGRGARLRWWQELLSETEESSSNDLEGDVSTLSQRASVPPHRRRRRSCRLGALKTESLLLAVQRRTI